MRKSLKYLFHVLVGSPYGFYGEGNEQWFYTVALAINSMLAWTYLPEFALIFTIISVIHLISINWYGIRDIEYAPRRYSIGYFVLHAVLLIIALSTNWWWTIITSLITAIAFVVAPDCVGSSILMQCLHYDAYEKPKVLIIHHVILMTFLITAICILPITVLIKVIIFVAAVIIHFIVDYLSGECIIITEVTETALNIVLHGDLKTQYKKELEEMTKK